VPIENCIVNILHIITGPIEGGAEALAFRLFGSDKTHRYQGVSDARWQMRSISGSDMFIGRVSEYVQGGFIVFGVLALPSAASNWPWWQGSGFPLSGLPACGKKKFI
jgi:hypothetical protein